MISFLLIRPLCLLAVATLSIQAFGLLARLTFRKVLCGSFPLESGKSNSRIGHKKALRVSAHEILQLNRIRRLPDPRPRLRVALVSVEVEFSRHRNRELWELLAAGRAVYIHRNSAKKSGNLQSWFLDLLEESGGERAVAASAVSSDLIRLRRIGYYRAASGID